MSQYNNISKLIHKIIGENRIKSRDFEELESFVEDFNKNPEIEEWLQENWNKAEALETKGTPLSFKKLQGKIVQKSSWHINTRKRIVGFGSIAAAVIGLLTLVGGVLFYGSYINTNPFISGGINNNNNNVTSTAELKEIVLERGVRSFNLSEESVNIKTQGVEVVGSKSNLKLFTKDFKADATIIQQWSTLKIPKGKDYYVILSDSTQIWMNACSELAFPDHFKDGKREVSLKGEAFFIVKSDVNNPFFVKTKNSTVRVTGTRFNVCSYTKENTSYITLVEGKVGVEHNGELQNLVPGQQFVQPDDGESYLKTVDPYIYISWKEGRFEFNDMMLEDMALRLEKWYDIAFDFRDGEASKHRFTGMIKKEDSIQYFIQLLQKTTDLNFTLQGSKIVVSTKPSKL